MDEAYICSENMSGKMWADDFSNALHTSISICKWLKYTIYIYLYIVDIIYLTSMKLTYVQIICQGKCGQTIPPMSYLLYFYFQSVKVSRSEGNRVDTSTTTTYNLMKLNSTVQLVIKTGKSQHPIKSFPPAP